MKKLKCLLSLVVTACILTLAVITGAQALGSPGIELTAAEGNEGETVDVYLKIENNPGITALSVQIGYSANDLELLSIENVPLFTESISTGQLSANPVSISWFSAGSIDSTSNGVLADLKFKIKQGAKTSRVTVSYDEDNIFDSSFTNKYFDTFDSTVTVTGSAADATTEPTTQNPSEMSDARFFAVDSARGTEGEEVEVELSVNNNPGITALSVQVGYSSKDLELVSISDAGLFDDAISTGKLTDNPISVSWFDSSSRNISRNGVFAVLKFRIKENAETSNLTLSFDEDNVFNSDFDNVWFTTVNGRVIVDKSTPVLIGDANLDGTVDVKDVTAIQRYLAELTVFTDKQLTAADTNGDGSVDIADATHLQMFLAEYDVVLGGQSGD